MTLRLWGLMAAGALSATLGFSGQADACGACFHGDIDDSTVVTGHRMALAVSPVHTVLWDQIQYSGDPAEFAWVLPVRPGAYVELATDAWFETLEAGTSVRVGEPSDSCPSSPGCGCGSDLAALSPRSGQVPTEEVTVLHEGTVGPYETVTIETETPGALQAWLTDNHFAVPDDLSPTIDAYAADGFRFIALRLAPGKGVKQMKPVRVVSLGPSNILPLRMVAGGAGAQMPIVLYVITEGRFETANFPAAVVPPALVTWDYSDQSSNYSLVREAALKGDDGRRFLTVYAQPNALLNFVFGFTQPQYTVGDATFSILSELYFAQARQNGELFAACSGELQELGFSTQPVYSPCPPGVPLGSSECTLSGKGLDATMFSCGTFEEGLADDLAVSLIGLHPSDVWVTRLEANLPRAALSEDLALRPAAEQEPLSNWILASRLEGDELFCGSAFVPPSSGGQKDSGRRTGGLIGLGLAAASLLALARRFGRTRLTLVPVSADRSRRRSP